MSGVPLERASSLAALAININRGVKYLFSFIKNLSNRPFLNLIYQVLLIRDTIFGSKYSAC